MPVVAVAWGRGVPILPERGLGGDGGLLRGQGGKDGRIFSGRREQKANKASVYSCDRRRVPQTLLTTITPDPALAHPKH